MRAAVIGTGAGGSVAISELAKSGYEVVAFDKGPQLYRSIDPSKYRGVLRGDELAGPIRRFEFPDSYAEPRQFEHRMVTTELRSGEINALPTAVGGGTIHWDAKTPRFWDIDFAKKSILGEMSDASIADWPYEYHELAPFYDEVEVDLGVQGSIASMARSVTLHHAPRARDFPMPPGKPQFSSTLIANAAERLGLFPFPMQSAINSISYGGRPACVDCGRCCGYGCTINARGSAYIYLERATQLGAKIIPNVRVTKIIHSLDTATGIEYLDQTGDIHKQDFDVVVLAASAIESIRLALYSDLPDPNKLVGKGIMFHSCIVGYGYFGSEVVNDGKGRNISHCLDDFADPDFPDARRFALRSQLPYIRGGVVELGFNGIGPIEEAKTIVKMKGVDPDDRRQLSELWRIVKDGAIRSRLLGIMMHAEDVRQLANEVVLSSTLKDWAGIPAPMIRYSVHPHEVAAFRFYRPMMEEILREAGAISVAIAPELRHSQADHVGGRVPTDYHTLGGLSMGDDPRTSIVDQYGRYRGMKNVLVVDGSVFPTSGGHNPTLTIMANALRTCRLANGGTG